jgi:hypothetical protein
MTAPSPPPPPVAVDPHGRRNHRHESAPSQPVINPPAKLRRSRSQLALALALIAVGGLAAAWIATNVGHTHSVLALRHSVTRGSVITGNDLTTAQINSDPTLQTVPATERDQMIGKYAASDLVAGSVITPSSVTTQTAPAKGQSLVGVALTTAQMPAQQLLAGDPVRIVLPAPSIQNTSAQPPATLDATVVDTHLAGGATDQTVVDVSVPSANAPVIAAAAASGHIALILDSAH